MVVLVSNMHNKHKQTDETCIVQSYHLKKPSEETLAKDSGRTKMNGKKKSYGSLVQHDERSVMPSRKHFAFFTPQSFSFTATFP